MEVIGGFGAIISYVVSLFTCNVWLKVLAVVGIIMAIYGFMITII